MNYIVRVGETIIDAILNSTGSLLNWADVLKVNVFDSWSPEVRVNQVIVIPDDYIEQTNNLSLLEQYPANNKPSAPDIDTQISDFLDLIN